VTDKERMETTAAAKMEAKERVEKEAAAKMTESMSNMPADVADALHRVAATQTSLADAAADLVPDYETFG
jgi:hypothetical protein